MRKKELILALSLLLAGGTAYADTSFDSYDENSDGTISHDEFHGTANDVGIFENYDSDNDGLLSDDEFGAVDSDWDYGMWDDNDDSYVDNNEFYDGYFDTYDDNEDGHWDGNEWDDANDQGWLDV